MALNKICFAMGFVALTTSTASASNYFDKNETCLQTSDIKAIQGHFTQFKKYTTSGKSEVCKDDLGEKWFEIVRSTLAMQRLSVTDQLQRDQDDDLTLRPITEKDWWSYFTNRANSFVVEPSYCKTNENIVAYVQPWGGRDRINLCPRFFTMDTPSQIEVLMHEVRHFDGHSHVTCTQGNENGSSGACDQRITSGGSYAVSVQTNVELSFVDQLSYADRVLAESDAVYSINNKFNSLPTTKSTDFIYAANADGEIWRMPKGNEAKAELVTTLKDAANIYGNGSQFTVFPVDTNVDAYRTSRTFTTRASAIGAYANMYNASSAAERTEYGAINYYGVGAIVKNNELHTFCGEQASTLSAKSFDQGVIQTLATLKDDKGEDHMYILSSTGDLYDFKCND